jgi:hypothetical protein
MAQFIYCHILFVRRCSERIAGPTLMYFVAEIYVSFEPSCYNRAGTEPTARLCLVCLRPSAPLLLKHVRRPCIRGIEPLSARTERPKRLESARNPEPSVDARTSGLMAVVPLL